MKKNLLLFICLLILPGVYSCKSLFNSDKPSKNQILVYSRTKGYRHKSIEKGIEAIKKLGLSQHFQVIATEDSSMFNDQELKKYKAIVFLSPTGSNLFNEQQKEALKNYIHNGGGFVGIHAATDCNYEWEWYGKMIGGFFMSHPKIQEAKLEVLDEKFIANKGIPKIWMHTEEWYNFKNFNPDVKVVLSVDEKSYTGGKMPDFHPISWYHQFEGGKVFYTALGHTDEDYTDELFLKHISGGIKYAMK
ncbi:MAG: ThuA domain-containing protein [Pelobium sp.]